MFHNKSKNQERLNEIDAHIQQLKDALVSASRDSKDQIDQEIQKWNRLRATIQRSSENKEKCDQYLQDNGLDFGAGRSHSRRSKFVPVHTEQTKARESLLRATQSARERGEAISRLDESAHALNADSADFEKAAIANANYQKSYFSNSLSTFFRSFCCCRPKTEETQPLTYGDEHCQTKPYG